MYKALCQGHVFVARMEEGVFVNISVKLYYILLILFIFINNNCRELSDKFENFPRRNVQFL